MLPVLFLLPVLFAQDAGLVLRTWVGYRLMTNTLSLTPELKTEAVSLGEQAIAAREKGKYGEAMRLLHRGTALMQGNEWTPAMSLASSLVPVVDHAVWEPGQTIQLRLKRLYAPDAGAPSEIQGELRLRPARGGGEPVPLGTVTGEVTSIRAPEVSAGAWLLEVKLPTLRQERTANIVVATGLASEAAALKTRVARIQADPGPALWTVQYMATLFDRLDRAEVGPSTDIAGEIRKANELLDDMEKGKDPFSGSTGSSHRAYLSKADNSLQPYRLYVPSTYTSRKPTPLVVALHGMGGDETSLLDRYPVKGLQEQADKYGFIVAAPKGRDSASMYRDEAEQDVLDVIAQVRKSYKIDGNRIYLTGHSMGGYGTWSIAMNHPELFAAIGPVAGGGDPAGVTKIRHVPQIVVHGDKDRTVNVSESRTMVDAARKLGAEVEYIEVQGGGHVEIFMPAMPKVFAFFAAHTKDAKAAAAGR